MNFAVVFGASLWSGHALPACHPENGNPRRQPAEVPLIKRENLSRQSRPPLNPSSLPVRTSGDVGAKGMPTLEIKGLPEKGGGHHPHNPQRRKTPILGRRALLFLGGNLENPIYRTNSFSFRSAVRR